MIQAVTLGADHGGLSLKTDLIPWLESLGYQVTDVGAYSLDPADDYPDFAERVARVVTSDQAGPGILICGSGVGACIAANKVPGIRACLCHDIYSAHQGVEHDNMNILCLGPGLSELNSPRTWWRLFSTPALPGRNATAAVWTKLRLSSGGSGKATKSKAQPRVKEE